MTALERFKDLLRTATPEARELARASVDVWCLHWLRDRDGNYVYPDVLNPMDLIRDATQAEAPVSEKCELKTGMHVGMQPPPLYAWPKDKRFHHGDRVLVVKIEGQS